MTRCHLPRARNWAALAVAFVSLTMPGRTMQPTAPVQTLSIEALGKGTAPIDGKWQFHLGDNMAWAQPDTPDTIGPTATDKSGWEQLTADKPWGAQGHPAYAGFGWYRKHLGLKPANGADPNFALLIPLIDDIYEIYWNGQLVGSHGVMPPHPKYFYLPAQQTFGLGPARDGVLAIRVFKTPLISFDSANIGGFEGVPLVGSPEAIAAAKTTDDYQWLRSQQFRFGQLLLYGIIAALAILIWLRNRTQLLLLALAAYCGSQTLVFLVERMRLHIPALTMLGTIQILIAINDIGIWYLLFYLFRLNELPRISRVTRTLAIFHFSAFFVDAILALLDWSNPLIAPWAPTVDGILTAIISINQFYPFVLIFFAVRRRLDLARWILAIAALLDDFVVEMVNTLEQGERFTHWTLGEKLAAPLFTVNGNAFPARVLSSTLLLAAIVFAVYHAIREHLERQTSVERELQSARELQRVLIPEALPAVPGYEAKSAYLPAQEVGGDFFQIIPLEGAQAGSTLLVLGDVSGKGLKAAMAVSLIVGALRTLAETANGPAEILAGLNRRLHGRLDGGFATCLAAQVFADGRVILANAGHLVPFRSGVELEMPSGLPLGLLPATTYAERTLQLEPGDALTLLSDGVVEARSGSGELFGFDRAAQLARLSADKIAEAAKQFGQEDDITVLTLTRLASAA